MSDASTSPQRLLERGLTGIDLTQTHALSRSVVRDAVEQWPAWHRTDLLGPPHREADIPPLTELREGLLT